MRRAPAALAVFSLLLFLLLPTAVSHAQISPPAAVRDGTGADVDWITTATEASANWDAVTFPPAAFGQDKWYDYNIIDQTLGGVLLFAQDYTVPVTPTTGTPPTSVTVGAAAIPDGLAEGDLYMFRVRGNYGVVLSGANDGGSYAYSDGFRVDISPPEVSLIQPSGIYPSTSVPISWSGSDGVGSGIAYYDVSYQIGGGAWTAWLTGTTKTQATFLATNGQSYRFRVRAVDKVGHEGTFTAASAFTVNSAEPFLTVTASPASLAYSASDTAQPLALTILAGGTTSVTLTGIRLDRTYPSWGTETGFTQSLSGTVPGGSTTTLNRTVTLDAVQRSKALGTSTTGGFTLTVTVTGLAAGGTSVTGVVSVPVTVTGGLSGGFTVQGVSIQLPSPGSYYLGDVIQAQVAVQASGSGTVQGQVTVDGSTSWSASPSFSLLVDGSTTFPLQDPLPATAGSHTVQVTLTSPASLKAQATYTVASEAAPFPSAITLVPGVAEIANLQGSAVAVGSPSGGIQQYDFTGSADLKLLSLGGKVLPGATVTHLQFGYPLAGGGTATVLGGSVEAEAAGATPLVTFANGYLKIRRLAFQGANPPADHLSADAMVALPALGLELFEVTGLTVGTEGVEDQSLKWAKSASRSFELFGMTFQVNDLFGGLYPAFEFGKDSGASSYHLGFSGALLAGAKKGASVSQEQLTTFRSSELVLHTDGSLDAAVKFPAPFDLVPGTLSFSEAALSGPPSDPQLTLKGVLKGLPVPLDVAGEIPFQVGVDKDGNGQVLVTPVSELTPGGGGHSLDGAAKDATEWNAYSLATVDLTYLGLRLALQKGVLDLDHGEVLLGVDLYLNLADSGGGTPAPGDRRVTFGELDSAGQPAGMVSLGMDGKIAWPAASHLEAIKGKRLALSPVELSMDAVGVSPDPFALLFSGSIVLGLPGVSGGVDFENLKVGLDGTVGNIAQAIQGGEFSVYGAVKVGIDSVDWSAKPSSLSFSSNETVGSGAAQTPKKGSKTVAVQSYFKMTGASMNLGPPGAPLMSGGFQEFTVYRESGGGEGLVVRQATLSMTGLDLEADVQYSPEAMLIAGSMKLPLEQIGQVAAVGKVGSNAGKPSMGLFVAVQGLNIPVAPAVFLDEVGGGFFLNPTNDDLAMVKNIAGFTRPELSKTMADQIPGGASNPKGFALMLLGGFYVAEKDLMEGRALVTLTGSNLAIDAQMSYADGLADGVAHLKVSWDPWYAEGNMALEANFASIVGGTGGVDFYVYDGVWGMDGKLDLSLLGSKVASGEVFLGSPGFMVSASFHKGVDLAVVSGSIDLGGMFWYYTVPDPDSLGAFAHVEVSGSFLAGLFSATAGMDGALILSPGVFIYAVGYLDVEVCYVTVFSGSLWVSAGSNGLDGGTGRNSQYEALIQQARQMSKQLKAAKQQLLDTMEQARQALAKLSAAQAQAAGLTLVEREGILQTAVKWAFISVETSEWGGADKLPPELKTVYNLLFGDQAEELAGERGSLTNLQKKIKDAMDALDPYQKAVAKALDQYQDILVEDLPSIQELGKAGNPFGGMKQTTVKVGSETRTVSSGFVVDQGKADSQKNAYSSMMDQFAQYQEAFMAQGGQIDARLQALDQILFLDDQNLTELMERYASVYSELSAYVDRAAEFHRRNGAYAEQAYQKMQQLANTQVSVGPASGPVIEMRLKAKAATLSEDELTSWNYWRIVFIDDLITAGQEPGKETHYQPPPVQDQQQRFVITGVELWQHIPLEGFKTSAAESPKRLQAALEAFRGASPEFLDRWGKATDLIRTVYERKAALYDVLYEIYDQLAHYGSGMMGLTSSGNAAGFAGMTAVGLSFRTSALAQALLPQATPLPPGKKPPSGPTWGPLNPLTPLPGSSALPIPGLQQSGAAGALPPGEGSGPAVADGAATGGRRTKAPRGPMLEEGAGSMVAAEAGSSGRGTKAAGALPPGEGSGPAVAVASPLLLPGMLQGLAVPVLGATNSLYGGALTLQLKETGDNLPGSGTFDRALSTQSPVLPAVSWVPVRTYFAAKRSEIAPYIETPHVDSLTGTVSSPTELEALLKASFQASHPVGVVEYEYQLMPFSSGGKALQESFRVQSYSAQPYSQFFYQKPPSAPLPGLGTGFGIVLPNTQGQGTYSGGWISPQIFGATPWLSVGTKTELEHLLVPEANDAGQYSLSVLARGAGGKSIVRRGLVTLKYFQPGKDTGPVTATLDSSDLTPPTAPAVTLSGTATAGKEVLYAKWSAGDPESGIQSYAYRVEIYQPPQEGQSAGTAPAGGGSGSGGGDGSGTTSTLQFLGQLTASAQAGTSAALVVVPWTEAGGRTQVNIRGLQLQEGVRYVVRVRATNGVGLQSTGVSAPILVDTTPPQAPAVTLFQQVTADGHLNSVQFTFSAGKDPESGVLHHRFALGRSATDTDLFPWTEVQKPSGTVANIPVAEGEEVFLRVRVTNGAGLESESAEHFIAVHYPPGPPQAYAIVLTKPMHFTSESSKMTVLYQIGQTGVAVPSGYLGFEYGVGTSPTNPNTLDWTPMAIPPAPYLIGQGPQPPSGGIGKVQTLDISGLSLANGATYYALLRVLTGRGPSATVASAPLLVDRSAPAPVTLTGPEENKGRDLLQVELKAQDPGSGIAAYRYEVWRSKDLVSLGGGDRKPGSGAEAVLAGWVSQGTYQGTLSLSGGSSGGATKPGQGLTLTAPGNLNLPQKPPWYASGWNTVGLGAKPKAVDLELLIKGFPSPGLQYGESYVVVVTVRNGAGVEATSNAVTLKVVQPPQNYKLVPKFSF